MLDLARYLADRRAEVDAALDRLLPPADERPARLHQAMRYSALAGGKRLRPILCMASAEAAGGTAEDGLLPGVAIECLHTYTLIHDDLPAMDNDDLRRGRPTSHRVFGEANAILAGDSLLTFAFEILSHCPAAGPLAFELARAAGSRGVAGGQFEDLAAEGQSPDADTLRFIHLHKTARLFEAACRMGGLTAGAPPSSLESLGEYGRQIGLAFQIADDILNATATPDILGKAVGTDAARGKMTSVAVHGLAEARHEAERCRDAALAALDGLPGPVDALVAVARHVVDRDR